MTRGVLAIGFCLLLVSTGTASAQSTEPAAPAQPQAQPAEREHDRPITHVFQNLYRDARRLPSLDTALLLGAGGGLALAVHPADDDLYEHATEGGPRQPYRLGSAMGHGWTQVSFAVGTYATGLIAGQQEITHFGSDLISAQVINAVVTQGVKFSARRNRPGGSSSSSAMPSGHTSSAFATAAVVWRHYGWKYGLPASAVGAWVGAGRVQLGRHYLSDVVMGATLGLVAGRSVTIGHGRTRVAVVPAAAPGGAAVTFAVIQR